MVYHDLSSFSGQPSESKTVLRIPSVFDRNLAFLIDFLIFSPIVGVLTAVLSKQLKLNLILETGSGELAAIWLLMFFFVFVSIVLMQSLSWFYFQATPGQYFTQVRVVHFPDSQLPLTFGQCALRSTLWFFSVLFFLIPFIEVIGHPFRRALHERASDTMVVTLKANVQDMPHPIERRFVSSWLSFFFSGALFFLFLFVIGIYNNLQDGKYSDQSSLEFLCEDVTGLSATENRIDQALTNYLGSQISASCLNQEADYLLWYARDEKLKSWALLAKALVTPAAELRLSYENTLCEKDERKAHCDLLKFVKAKGASESKTVLSKNLQKSAVVQFLETKYFYSEKEFIKAAQSAQRLRNTEGLQATGNVLYVKSIVSLLREQNGSQLGDRKIASISASPSKEQKSRKQSTASKSIASDLADELVESFLKELEAP